MQLLAIPVVALVCLYWACRILSRSWLSVRVSRWVEGAFCGLLGTISMYAWGVFEGSPFDIEETCRLNHGQQWDPDAAGPGSLFPLSNKCNATYELVPAYVNPLIYLGIATVVVCLGMALHQARTQRKNRPEQEVE
ncbi:hypothetical protein ACFVFQ_34940 [Streptomyces sp. NPDC057743]|uniref:hypothetical protein n=1 Tax=Streptomyces sp. NPDC057743 TaxID=3346236 RepID=UPI003693C04F